MTTSTAMARKAAYLFLTLCAGALLAFGCFRLYEEFGPSKIFVGTVPFGMPSGSSVTRGISPEWDDDISKLPAQTQAELRRAVELSRGGNSRAALEIFEALTLVYPNFIQGAWEEINTLFEMDSLSDQDLYRAKLLTEKLENRFPKGGIPLYLESRNAFRSGNISMALQLAQVASEKSPALYETHLWYAKLLKNENRYVQAILESHMAISLSAGADQRAYELLAGLYHDQGSIDSCTAVVEYALSQFPADAELLLIQGYLYEYQGRFDSAEKIYRRILAFDAEFTKASNALATLGEKSPPGTGSGTVVSPRDRAQVACDILEPLVEKYPENLPLREALGLAYLKGRDFDKARLHFREIQSKDPEYPEIQRRIQEASVTRPAPVSSRDGLTANLNRAVDSLRESMAPSTKHDFTTMLGHYLVRYGATPGEFFKKYAVSNFRPVRTNAWQESFYDAPYRHTYTVVFDSLNRFREIHVKVLDSSSTSNHLGVAPEVYTRFLKQNSRISGIGNSTGETDCGDGVVIDAAVWETQDNFEILARFIGASSEIRMVRFDKSVLPPGLKLCDYVSYLKEF